MLLRALFLDGRQGMVYHPFHNMAD